MRKNSYTTLEAARRRKCETTTACLSDWYENPRTVFSGKDDSFVDVDVPLFSAKTYVGASIIEMLTDFIRRISVNTSLDQKLDHLEVSKYYTSIQRSPSARISGVFIGVSIEKLPKYDLVQTFAGL